MTEVAHHSSDARRRWSVAQPYVVNAALALIIGTMLAIMFAVQHRGHWWGDDWALYIRQAEGLLDGNPGKVGDENVFTTTMSAGAPFSPGLYPWGFPFLLALAIPFVGSGVDDLVIVPFLGALAFALGWYGLAKPRIGAPTALVGLIAVCFTPLLLGWAELIQSEFPFAAAVMLTLVWLDRLIARDGLLGIDERWLSLVLLGFGAFFAFETRREGFGLIPAIAAAQLVVLIGRRGRGEPAPWRLPRRELRHLAARCAVPHATALVLVVAAKVLLPTVIVPKLEGVSAANIWTRKRKHVGHLAELAGFKRPGIDHANVFGSVRFGWTVVVIWLILFGAGVVLAFTLNRQRDAHLVVYILVAGALGTSFSATLSRYLVSVAPLISLLALTAVVTLAGWKRRWIGVVVATALLIPIAGANLHDANKRIDNAERFEEYNQIEWGAQHPDAIEMFDQVKALTEPNDIVASPKGRAMVLETGRRSVQVDDYRPMPTLVTPDLVVTDMGSKRVAELANNPSYREAWRNSRFVLYTLVANDSPT
ncbi:MAG TPA: hypothetical protein VMM60_16620 [Ilumatobacter sp.]|nr:hypothetical protein [Ilumatobacter sp.]